MPSRGLGSRSNTRERGGLGVRTGLVSSAARIAAALAVFLLVCVAPPVLAASSLAPSGASSGSEASADGRIGIADAVVASAEREEERKREWLDTPEAKLEREQSRTAYDDLTSLEAENLIGKSFPEELKQLDGDPSRVLSDLEIEEVVGTYSALVPDAE